jgi:nitrogen regulatory protein PII
MADNGVRLKLVFIIVDWNKLDIIRSVFEQVNVRFHFVSKGQGTDSVEKAIILCLEQEIMVPSLLKEVVNKLNLSGIGFSVPLSGINEPILKVFKESIEKNAAVLGFSTEKGEKKMEIDNSRQHDLIVSVINQGYSNDFLAIAREAGANEGAVISAQGLMHKGPVKFFGISVQDEKELIIILSEHDKMQPVMEAVSKNFGITSKAGGIVFSLPAENVTR